MGQAVYFDRFPRRLGENLARDARICILAVDSRAPFWLKGLARARFESAPGVRLYGRVVGERRPATAAERAGWERRVRWLPGYEPLWGHLDEVRDLELDRFEPVQLGPMTAGLWR